MAIVSSYGALSSTYGGTMSYGAGGGSLNLYGASMQTYAAIYRTQPNVRTVIEFLARNVAQLGIHVFRRTSDTDRERLSGHELAGWLSHPNPGTTRYRLVESLMNDLGIYFNAYWLKVRSDVLGLVRLPPEQMQVEGGLTPSAYIWTREDGKRMTFAPSEIVHFGGYDPCNPLMGLSPLETLRRILAEENAAGEYRQQFWNNAGRMDAVIERPATAPKWNPTQAAAFVDQWQKQFAGGAASGKTAVLEDGMQLKPTSFSAKESQFMDARKLTREECARSFHVPLPMVGILDHATFSNIREQHKHLYQDCLGPWLVMIEQEIERQLLIECVDQRDVYVEFNIAEKLKGDFEEQANSLRTLTGRPIMTADESRARLNLPSMGGDAAKLAAQQGGPSDARSNTGDTAIAALPTSASQEAIDAAWNREAPRV